MVDFLKGLNMDKWYGVVLYLGFACCAAPFFGKVVFIDQKHLFGVGVSLLLISLSFFIADKHVFWREGAYLVQTKVIKHSLLTYMILSIGILMLIIFLFRVVIGLL
ncbi:hypothetical protein DHW03_16055 [Pedobacter yonginense]|uniref:Uncharacterized protein n=1 Tax=Pedobacter yonginense TaxID=651869 RepID=A0A317EJM6_9SPHI|nr:hypothetical protein DHW03_16055 [Pedobacter yonginense]